MDVSSSTPSVSPSFRFLWGGCCTSVSISKDVLDQNVHTMDADSSANIFEPREEDTSDVSVDQIALPKETTEPTEPIKFDWETGYFKRFDWLNEDTEKYIVSENLSKYVDHLDLDLMDDTPSLSPVKPNFLYFVSLDNDKMFLYNCPEKPEKEVLEECEALYEYVQINRPIKIVFFIPNIQYKEIDENVKLFMHQFGIENTRGGSYTDVELLDEIKMSLMEEFANY